MKQSRFLHLISAGVFLCLPAAMITYAQTPETNPSTPTNTPTATSTPEMTAPRMDDKRFAKDAAVNNMVDVELGKLAAQKGSKDEVKQFGQKMVNDHTKVNDQLKQVANKQNIPIPDALDSKHQSRVDKLSKLSGEQFDKAYVKDQLKDHQSQVNNFNAEALNGTDPNVKTFANAMLPTLQQNVELAKNLNKSEKKGGGQ